MSERRLRFLHKSYSRTGRWGWRVARRIRSFGWGLALFSTIAAVLGTNVEDSAIYMIFCFAVCALATAFIWVLLRNASLAGRRSLPAFGSVDQSLDYLVEITNTGPQSIAAMTFEEWPPLPIPDYETFAHTPEPGEEKRNIVDRTLLFYRWSWLQERERGFSLLEASDSPSLIAPGEKKQVRFRLTPQHRGILRLAELRVLLPDPFGLFQKCRLVKTPPAQITILPKRYPLTPFALTGKTQLQLGGEALSNNIGQTGDFLHLRDYRSGDAMRAVDWKSWARTGTPVVREYEDQLFPQYGVILDTAGPPGKNFEEAISVAASFVSNKDSDECLLDLIFIGQKSYHLTTGPELSRRSALLEVLATAQARSSVNYQKLLSKIQDESEHLSALLLILPGWSPEQRAFLAQLRKNGLTVIAFVVAPQEVTEAYKQKPLLDTYFLCTDQVGTDLMSATSRLKS